MAIADPTLTLKSFEDCHQALRRAGASSRPTKSGVIYVLGSGTVIVPNAAHKGEGGRALSNCRAAVRRLLRKYAESAPRRAETIIRTPPPVPSIVRREPTPPIIEPRSLSEAARLAPALAGSVPEVSWDVIERAIPEKRLQCFVCFITPEIANHIVSTFNVHNRPLHDSWVKQFSRDITADATWGLTHQGMAFSHTGVLLDGQHRLFAVDEARTGFWTVVMTGLDPSAQAHMDQGHMRTAIDVEKLDNPDSEATKLHLAVAHRMQLGVRASTVAAAYSRASRLKFYHEHTAAIDFVIGTAFAGRRMQRIMPASVCAVMGRAFYHIPEEEVARIGKLLLDGLSTEEREFPIILLRNWLLANQPEYSQTAQRVSKEIMTYMKAQRAVKAFHEHEHVKMLYPMRDEAFSLPGEGPFRSAAGRSKRGAAEETSGA